MPCIPSWCTCNIVLAAAGTLQILLDAARLAETQRSMLEIPHTLQRERSASRCDPLGNLVSPLHLGRFDVDRHVESRFQSAQGIIHHISLRFR